jgi:hypothetical protein
VGYVTYVEEKRNKHEVLVTDSQNKEASGRIILKFDFSSICSRQNMNDSGTVQLRNIQVPKNHGISWPPQLFNFPTKITHLDNYPQNIF